MANWSLLNRVLRFCVGLGLPSPTCRHLLKSCFISILVLPLSAQAVITFEHRGGLLPYAPTAFAYTRDGGYLITSEIFFAPPPETIGHNYITLQKFDSFGIREWRYRTPHRGTGTDLRALDTSPDGHYFVAGLVCEDGGGVGITDPFLMKVKSNGLATLWEYIYQTPGFDRFSAVAATTDGGCFAHGALYSDTGFGVGIVRLGQDGNVKWVRIFRLDTTLYYYGGDVMTMPDGGCVVAGDCVPYEDTLRIGSFLYVLRTDAAGELIWAVIDSNIRAVWPNPQLSFTPEGNIAICGLHYNQPGEILAGFVSVFSPEGAKILDKLVMPISSRGPGCVFIRDGRATPDGGFVLVGEISPNTRLIPYDILLIRLNAKGDSIWARTFGIPGNLDVGWGVVNTNDGGFCIVGNGDVRGVDFYGWLIKTDSLGMLDWVKAPVRSCTTSIRLGTAEKDSNLIHPRLDVSPNPFTKSARIHYQLPSASQVLITAIEITGRTVATLFEGYQPAGNHQLRWHPEGLAQGIYFIKLQTPDLQLLERTILLP